MLVKNMRQKDEIILTATKNNKKQRDFASSILVTTATVMRQLLRLRRTQIAFCERVCETAVRLPCPFYYGICLVITDLPRSTSSASSE